MINQLSINVRLYNRTDIYSAKPADIITKNTYLDCMTCSIIRYNDQAKALSTDWLQEDMIEI